MLVSIIIPVYNVEGYLVQCLESICNQTYRGIEIIIINDGSVDNSLKICESYAQKDHRIKLISKQNGGLVSAWKVGVAIASGSYIAFIDSDDFVSNDYIELMVNSLDDNVDMVCMNCVRYLNSGEQSPTKINTLPGGVYCPDEKFYANFIAGQGQDKYIANSRWAKLIRASIAKEYAQYCSEHISVGEDQQFTIGVLLGCKKIVLLDEYKYYYRYNPSSIMRSYKKDLWSKSKLLIKTISNIPGIEKIKNIDDQLKLQLLAYLFECLKNEQCCGSGLTKDYFLSLVNEAHAYNLFALPRKAFYGKLDRMLFNPVKNKRYIQTKLVLNLYRFLKRI